MCLGGCLDLWSGGPVWRNFAQSSRARTRPTPRSSVACEQLDVEGVVLKRLKTSYVCGRRSMAWRRVRCSTWHDHLERRGPRRSDRDEATRCPPSGRRRSCTCSRARRSKRSLTPTGLKTFVSIPWAQLLALLELSLVHGLLFVYSLPALTIRHVAPVPTEDFVARAGWRLKPDVFVRWQRVLEARQVVALLTGQQKAAFTQSLLRAEQANADLRGRATVRTEPHGTTIDRSSERNVHVCNLMRLALRWQFQPIARRFSCNTTGNVCGGDQCLPRHRHPRRTAEVNRKIGERDGVLAELRPGSRRQRLLRLSLAPRSTPSGLATNPSSFPCQGVRRVAVCAPRRPAAGVLIPVCYPSRRRDATAGVAGLSERAPRGIRTLNLRIKSPLLCH